MRPLLFEIEIFGHHLAFNGYGFMIGLALVTWAAFVRREALRLGEKKMAEGGTITLFILIAALFLGGKGLYFLTIAGDESSKASLETGFVFWGSILAATPAMYLRLKSLGVPIYRGLDIFAAATPWAHALGRIGCFLAGCCYGHRCTEDFPLAVVFHAGVGLHDLPLHPVQIYEALGLLLLFTFLWCWLRKRKSFDGQLFYTYFIGYSLLRCVTESFRGDPGRKFLFGGGDLGPGDRPSLGSISTSVFISLMMALVGVVFYLLRRRRCRRS